MFAIDVHGSRCWPNLSPLRGLIQIIWTWSWGSRPRLNSLAPTGLIRIADSRPGGQFIGFEDLHVNRPGKRLEIDCLQIYVPDTHLRSCSGDTSALPCHT